MYWIKNLTAATQLMYTHTHTHDVTYYYCYWISIICMYICILLLCIECSWDAQNHRNNHDLNDHKLCTPLECQKLLLLFYLNRGIHNDEWDESNMHILNIVSVLRLYNKYIRVYEYSIYMIFVICCCPTDAFSNNFFPSNT